MRRLHVATGRPLVCLVTDRRGLVSAAASDDDACAALVRQVDEAAACGVDLVQVRELDLAPRRLLELTSRLVAVVGTRSTAIVVTDRVDIARSAGAHGVQLRESSMPASRVRPMVSHDFLLGRSVHSPQQVSAIAAMGEVDYVTFGTVFPTPSKPASVPKAGLEGLARACTARIPVLAIGGVTLARLPGIAAAGAAGIAAIRLFEGGGDKRGTVETRGIASVVGAVRACEWTTAAR
ncbi:MAG: thiamine phosphate synthase [Vicinamibacterales bacterium]